jgi:hypothetical protein
MMRTEDKLKIKKSFFRDITSPSVFFCHFYQKSFHLFKSLFFITRTTINI